MANKIISSEYTNKKMYYANFNITFGNDSEPMLEHFFDIIYPAMTSGYIRESPNKTGMNFVLTDVKVKEIDDDIVLVGNYVKNMGYSVNITRIPLVTKQSRKLMPVRIFMTVTRSS